jgi:hypothetical protein
MLLMMKNDNKINITQSKTAGKQKLTIFMHKSIISKNKNKAAFYRNTLALI